MLRNTKTILKIIGTKINNFTQKSIQLSHFNHLSIETM